MSTLDIKAFAGLLFLALVIAALLFGSAGTFDYWQAWTFLAVHVGASVAVTVYLIKCNRQLLARRMRGGARAEKRPAQKIVMHWASLGYVGLLVVPALDRRFGWSHMPPLVALAGDALVALGWLVVFLVFRENSFAAATIELADDHKLVATGPYALVRHPMYAGGLVLLLGMPIALGSWWGIPVFVAIVPPILWRLSDEERFLAKNLPGYVEYQAKTPYRLLPWVW